MTSENTHYLVRSSNSALSTDPVYGYYTMEEKAQEVADALRDAEQENLEASWGNKWTLFASKFYVAPVDVDAPKEEVLARYVKSRFPNSD